MSVSDHTTWWAPIFKVDDVPTRSMAVPWRREGPPTNEEYKDALVDRIDELIKANRKEARWSLDVEFESICVMENREHWAMHIGLSPQMNMMLARINWAVQSDKFVFGDDEETPALSDYVDGLGVQ
jgi:hypothetical protein